MAVSVRETLEFLDTLFRNKLSEAERILQQLEEKHPDDKRYLHALRGIYISYTGGRQRLATLRNLYKSRTQQNG
jgi:hypothetical protein